MKATTRIFALALLTASLPAMAADAGLAGKWKLVSEIDGTTRESVCTFHQDGAKFSGECKREGSTTSITGSVAEKAVHMTGESEYSGTPIHLTYDAKLVDDATVKGSVDVQPFGVDGTFTLTKQ